MFLKVGIFGLICCISTSIQSQHRVISKHSHNDYERAQPLFMALNFGFQSIEADIFEYNEQIVVSHDEEDLHLKPTLQDLYLDPLSSHSFDSGQSIILLIDLKMGGRDILESLHTLLEKYKRHLKNRDLPDRYAPIQVVLSGSVAKEWVIANKKFAYFFVDGRIDDLGKNIPPSIMPLISANLEDVLRWKPMTKVSKNTLNPIINVIQRTHNEGKWIRFWNTPEEEDLWDLLIALEVDLIGVDNINKFVQYELKF